MFTVEATQRGEAFEERARFLREAAGIEVEDFLSYGTDPADGRGTLSLDVAALLRALLRRSLTPELLSAMGADENGVDAVVEAFVPANDEPLKVPQLVFNRFMVNQVVDARGDEIPRWFDQNLKEVADQVTELGGSASPAALATVMISADVVTLTIMAAMCFKAYGLLAPGVPAAFESGFLYGITSAAMANPVAAGAVIAAVAVIETLFTVLTLVERRFTGLIVNDTPFDIEVGDVYMRHGELVAMIGADGQAGEASVIPARRSGNMVYSSFYSMTKRVGFYGAEGTMRLELKDGIPGAFFLLSANPYSESSRVGLERKFRCSYGEVLHSEDVHQELYDAGVLDYDKSFWQTDVHLHLNSAHGSNAYAVLAFRCNEGGWVNFSCEQPETCGTMRVNGCDGFSWRPSQVLEEACHAIAPGGHVCLNAFAGDYNHYVFEMRADGDEPVAVLFYDSEGNQCTFEVSSEGFGNYSFSTVRDASKSRCVEDLVQVENLSAGSTVLLRGVACVPSFVSEVDRAEWMGRLADDTPLCDVNLPASHDAAAINAVRHTPWACHHASITEQLNFGVRVFDVRIKAKDDGAGGIELVTCHGAIGGGQHLSLNEFEPLSSVLRQMTDFLTSHWSEAVFASLKIDDWAVADDRREEALSALDELIDGLPFTQRGRGELGTVVSARGKLVLFDRITSEGRFGYVVGWESNTSGGYAWDGDGGATRGVTRDFDVYVQDHFQMGFSTLHPAAGKAALVRVCAERSRPGDGELVLNYASACKAGALGVYCHRDLLSWLGGLDVEHRPKKLGWLFMDYESDAYLATPYGNVDLVSLVIASNFGYEGFSRTFSLA